MTLNISHNSLVNRKNEMLNLGKFVKEKPIVKAVKSLPSPVGWWEITSAEGEEGQIQETHGTFYGHIAEILFSVPNDARWQYSAKLKPDMPKPAKRPFYTPARQQFDMHKRIAGIAAWEDLNHMENFIRWINCPDRIKIQNSKLYESYTLTLLD